MKRMKFWFTAFILISGAIAAFASSQRSIHWLVYYKSGNTCLPGVTDHLCSIGEPDCAGDIIDGPINVQLFNDRELRGGSQSHYRCIEPFDETPGE